MRIIIETVKHSEQRYATCGDWQYIGDELVVRVSDTGDVLSNVLVGIHELVEAVLCKANGIPESAVDFFDKTNPELEEPGNSPEAPYHKQHVVAEIVERLVASEAHVVWQDHDYRVMSLGEDQLQETLGI